MTQAFFHQGECFGVVARLCIDHAVGVQPRLIKAWRKQVAGAQHPQHLSRQSRDDPGDEQQGGGIVRPTHAFASNLVQGIDPQTAPGLLVDRIDSERQNYGFAGFIGFDGSDKGAQIAKG